MKKKISVIIPAYNEEKRIGKTLGSLYSYMLENYPDFEIIVVDDGSFDRTADIVAGFMKGKEAIQLLKNGVNRGKGYAVKRGVHICSGEIILFSDADQSVPISELPKFIKALEDGADIVIASRALRGASILKRQAVWRQTMGKIFNMFVRVAVFPGIKDTQCGFKCFKEEAARRLFDRQKIERFAFDVEILYLAWAMGYSVAEIPARWVNSPDSRVDPLRDSLNMIKDLLAIKRMHRIGK